MNREKKFKPCSEKTLFEIALKPCYYCGCSCEKDSAEMRIDRSDNEKSHAAKGNPVSHYEMHNSMKNICTEVSFKKHVNLIQKTMRSRH